MCRLTRHGLRATDDVRERRDESVTVRVLFGVVVTAATLIFGSGQAICAEEPVMFPDAHGKMVRIHIAHSFEQCLKNGRNLGYPEGDSRTWCTQHCNGKICQ
jgi:hypothetical protein